MKTRPQTLKMAAQAVRGGEALSSLRLFFLGLTAALLVMAMTLQAARAVEVERVVSPGGIEAWLVEDHSNPIISMEFSFKGGATLDPEGKEGTANMLSGMLDEGAGPYDSKAFRARLENLSIRLSFDAGLDRFSGSFQTLVENEAEARELLRLSLSEPRFDEEPMERIRGQILVGIARDETDPSAIASKTLRRTLFPGHPYGRSQEGTAGSVAGITRVDLQTYLAENLTLDRLKIGVVGDIAPEALGALLDEVFGSLPKEGRTPEPRKVSPTNLGEVLVVEQAVPQSSVTLAKEGVMRHDPDYYTAYVVNYVLGGGGFASRLFEEVREKRGLAYSVYRYLYPFDETALIVGGTATVNERVAESLEVMLGEWRRMADEGPTAEELEKAKTYLTGSFPLRFSNSPRIAGMLVGMQQDELGIDYLDRRNSYIEAVTLEDARRVAKELFDPDDLTVIVVGQPEGIEPTRKVEDVGQAEPRG